jgi:hypothetical protein
MEIALLAPTDLILVAIMPQPRDLEIARLLGWYRIPLRSAPKVLEIDWLAFYQTGAFPKAKWRIEVLAPVRGHELTTRAELLRDEPDHPHAHQEYYKMQLGPLQRLARPLPAQDWRRITFFYTTGEQLGQAQSVSDLVLPVEGRQFLWGALRERALHAQAYHTAPAALPEFDLPAEVLAALLGVKEADAIYAARSEAAPP